MDLLADLGALLGGIGLFLLGMWLMTDGLKLAAGGTLRAVLEHGTRTPMRALLAGTGLTATVQSSSAVTVATVGFVNAGLLTLGQAVWVIYGANIGTTMTGWIVAVTGVEVRLDAWALPLVGIGILLRTSGPSTRRAAWGQALAGFAIFLVGIQSLKSNFSVLATQVDLAALPTQGLAGIAAFFAVGMVLTVLIQSSSATSAIAISAAAAGLVPVHSAALVMIGADLGTSSTAAIAAAGATPNARRTAVSHVLFNGVTTIFAVLTLDLLIAGVDRVLALFGSSQGPAMTLALFSTTFNIIGVLLMWPFTGTMVRLLERSFVSAEEDLARTRHLDATLLEVPALSLRGVLLELQRLGQESLRLAGDTVGPGPRDAGIAGRGAALDTLADRIRRHVAQMNRAVLPPEIAEAIGQVLRALQHYEEVLERSTARVHADTALDGTLLDLQQCFATDIRRLLAAADTAAPAFSRAALDQSLEQAENRYQALKRELLAEAAAGRLPIDAMDRHMLDIARLRRSAERAAKAAHRLAPLLRTAAIGSTDARADTGQRGNGASPASLGA